MTFSRRCVAIISLLAFIAVGFLGIYYSAGMEMSGNNEMNGCIFSGQATLCKMNIIEHIGLWQSMFTAIPQEIALLIVILALLTAAWIAFPNSPPLSDAERLSEWRLYITRHIELPIFDPLRRAFSKGILHPKIYESELL